MLGLSMRRAPAFHPLLFRGAVDALLDVANRSQVFIELGAIAAADLRLEFVVSCRTASRMLRSSLRAAAIADEKIEGSREG